MHKLTSFILAGLLALCVALPVQAAQVPFTAVSKPDFSKIVTIHVPDGWKHRNAEGKMELQPPKEEGYVIVDVFHLDGRTPQQMVTLLATDLPEGETPEKYAGREGAWMWYGEPASGGSCSNFFVGSAKDDVYVHFSWRNTDDSAIFAILGNSVMAGAPVSAEATLLAAIEARDMAAFRAALDAGANVNGRDMNMKPVMASTPLMVACRTGQFDMARELVERGADINAQTGVGATAFLLAAEHPGTSEFLQYLQGKGANIHWSMDAFGGALELAALQNPDIKVFHTLIGMGVHKDEESGAQSASLVDRCFIAAVRGNPNPEVIKLFVGMGANVQARDHEEKALAWEGSEIEEKPERLEWLKKNTDLPIPAQAQKRTYSYRSEGAVGTLELGTKYNDGKYNISIHTTNESNLRMCEFDGNCVRTDSGLTCDNPESVVPELRLTIQELKNGELEVSVNLPEFKVCGAGPGIAGRYVPKRNGNAAQTTPAASQQQGRKEVKGEILKEVPYKDSRGNNVVILSRSDRDGDTRSSDLYAYGYANDGASPSLSWKLYDYFHECPVDLTADFSEQSPIITDLDKNGISEVWLVYYIGCRGDVSPDSMKIIMYEGSKKYALRGETVCPTGDGKYMGGKYTADPAFKDAPPEFRRYADKLWQKNKKRF